MKVNIWKLLGLLFIVIFALSTINVIHAVGVTTTVSVGNAPTGIAYDLGKGEIFVANEFSSTVSVISDGTNAVVATVTVGTQPEGVAYDSVKNAVFVTNYGAGTVSVISDTSNTVTGTITVGNEPYGIAFDATKGELFVANKQSASVSVISDTSNAVVATVNVGASPSGVAYDSALGEIFVSSDVASGTVSVISDTTNAVVATVAVGGYPFGLAYDPSKGEIFVTNAGSAFYGINGTVSVVSDSTNTVVATVTAVNYPYGVAYDASKGEIFVANEGDATVSVISDSNNVAVGIFGVGEFPEGVAYDSGKSEIFVANNGDDNVSVISDSSAFESPSPGATATSNPAITPSETFNYDNSSGKSGPGVVGVGPDPIAIAYDAGKGEVFVSDFSGPTISVIDCATNSIVTTIDVPGLNNPGFKESPSPSGIAYDSVKGEVFVANEYGNCLTVISDSSNTVTATIDLGNDSVNKGIGLDPISVAYDSVKGEVFVVDIGATTTVGSNSASAGMVSVISDATNSVVATVAVGSDPNGIAYDAAKGELFVTNAGRNPSDISAANFNTGVVSVISDATNTVVATVPVGPFPQGIAYDSIKGELFVTNGGKTATSSSPATAGSVSVISDKTNTVIATAKLPNAGEVAYDSGKNELFVVTGSTNSVSIISDTTNSVTGTKAAGSSPYALAYDPAQNEIFVTNTDASTVTIISDATTTAPSKTTGSSSGGSWLWILIVLAIIVILILLVLMKRRKKPSTDDKNPKFENAK